MSQFLSGAGSAFSSLGSQVAAQASVPHQDLALVCSLLLLWSSVGAAVGEAVAGQYWGAHMPENLRKYLPSSVSDEEVSSFYMDITTIKAYEFGSAVRNGATRAYEYVSLSSPLFQPFDSRLMSVLICAGSLSSLSGLPLLESLSFVSQQLVSVRHRFSRSLSLFKTR